MPVTPALTQACEDRDFVEWHRGCTWCAVWVLWLDAPHVQAQVQQARAALGDKLLARYARQPHVTVAYRGLMDSDGHPAAEYGPAHLQADVQALAQAGIGPLRLRVQGVGSFETVPYLVVQGWDAQDAQRLQALHDTLAQPWAGWRYVPHVTLGHYAGAWPQRQVLQQLQQALHPQEGPEALVCERLWLVCYATHDVAGPLLPEGYWDLQRQCYVPCAAAVMPRERAAIGAPGGVNSSL